MADEKEEFEETLDPEFLDDEPETEWVGDEEWGDEEEEGDVGRGPSLPPVQKITRGVNGLTESPQPS